MNILFIYPNLMLVTQLPNNIALLSAILKEGGHKVELFDTTFYPSQSISNDEMRMHRLHVKQFDTKYFYNSLETSDMVKELRKTINRFQPDLIAISLLDDTKNLGLKLLESIKDTNIPVIAGGIYSIFNSPTLLKGDLIDFICYGEGERTILKLSNTLEQDMSIDDVPNLIYKSDNSIIKTPPAKLVDIDTLPLEDYSIFDKKHFSRPMRGEICYSLPINIDRGCVYNCSFCVAQQLRLQYGSGYFRVKSIERIRKELQYQLEKYPNTNLIYFNSENFMSRTTNWLKEFKDMYREFDLSFWCQASIQSMNQEKIAILGKMPIQKLSVGIEHGNDDFRKKILNKTFSNTRAIKTIEMLKREEIPVGVNNILGLPDETRQLLFDTINLNRILKLKEISGFVFQPYTGTSLRDYCIEKNYINKDTEVDSLFGNSVLNMPQFSPTEINALAETFVLYVLMPKNRWGEIKQAEHDRELLIKLRNQINIDTLN